MRGTEICQSSNADAKKVANTITYVIILGGKATLNPMTTICNNVGKQCRKIWVRAFESTMATNLSIKWTLS